MCINFVAIPINESEYIVVKKEKVIRRAHCCGADEADTILKPKPNKGEVLYIRVGGQ